MQVRKRDTQRIYALKTIRKAHIVNRGEITHTLAERLVLSRVTSPFIVPLKFSFQSEQKLYLVLACVCTSLPPHASHPDRLNVDSSMEESSSTISNANKSSTRNAVGFTAQNFSSPSSTFMISMSSIGKQYTSMTVIPIRYLHLSISDLKPENILLDYTGHIALCDFGLCKLNMKDNDMTNTFCGTPEYLAPEILNGAGYSTQPALPAPSTKRVAKYHTPRPDDRLVDSRRALVRDACRPSPVLRWCVLALISYPLLARCLMPLPLLLPLPFPPLSFPEITDKMYEKILRDPLLFPDEVSPSARSILTGLLTRDPAQRLGVNGADVIKRHRFFEKIDWQRLAQKKIQPPFKPSVRSPVDVSNFDTVFTAEQPLDSVVEGSRLSQTVQAQFEGAPPFFSPIKESMDVI
jgi:serum/glucocorticoid-regulated kinase 2